MSKIYEPKGRAREYSPLALNIFKGCTHGCKYCYVPRMFQHFNLNYNHAECSPQVDFVELEKSAAKLYGCGKQILLSFTGDPYCGVSTGTTLRVLEVLNYYKHHVAILTKGGTQCLEHLETFKQFGNRIKVGATLTFDNEKDSKAWEPGSATPDDRIEALKVLHTEGITTWASFEPVIIPEQSLHLLEMSAPYLSHCKIGKINNYMGLDKRICWQKFIKESVDICRNAHLPFYIKNDLATFNKNVSLSWEERNQDFLNI